MLYIFRVIRSYNFINTYNTANCVIAVSAETILKLELTNHEMRCTTTNPTTMHIYKMYCIHENAVGKLPK